MKKRYIFLIIVLISFTGYSQSRKTLKADKLFDRFKFQDAIKEYKKLVRTDKKDRTYIYQRLADAYSTIGESYEAEKWYEKIVQQNDVDPIYYFRYAMTLRQNKKYEESIEWMRKYRINSGMSDTRLQEFFKELDVVEKIKKDGIQAQLFNININSPYTEYGGTYYKDNKIVYTTNNIKAKVKKVSAWDNLPFTDLKVALKEGDQFEILKDDDPNINTDFHESSPTFSSDYTVMFFTRNNLDPQKKKKVKDYNLKIYRSFLQDDGKWSMPEEVHFDSNEYNCAHPVLSKDNHTLYFVSDMPGTFGKSDIYKAKVNDDWSLGEPENMGKHINTEGIETFPFIDTKNNLYFSSDGHAGLGGLDIFVAFYVNNKFLMLKNLGLPYNSSKDDFAFILNDNESEGFISSNRLGGNGSDDIYLFKTTHKFKPLIYFIGYTKDENNFVVPNARITLYDDKNHAISKTLSMYNGRFTFLLDPNVKYHIKVNKNNYDEAIYDFDTYNIEKANIKKTITLKQKQKIKGCVADFDSKKPLDHVEVKVYGHNSDIEQKFIIYTNPKGCFDFEVPAPSRHKEVYYEFEFRKSLYLPKRYNYKNTLGKDSINWLKPNKERIYMIKLKLEPIYFDLDKAEIRPDAAKELDKIVELLNKYPDIKLSMESHTDSRNTDEYNMDLSERRAKATMQYLIDHGIDPERLQAKGFGETRPVNHCIDGVKCTEKEYQMNRRTEFMIIN